MNIKDPLESRLKAGEVIIMDGGTGSEIRRRGTPTGERAWEAEATSEGRVRLRGNDWAHPELIREIHEDYIKARAEIIITNTFSTGRDKLELAGLADRTAELNRLGVKLAREAQGRAGSDRPVLIAGSMSTITLWGEPSCQAILREGPGRLPGAGPVPGRRRGRGNRCRDDNPHPGR